MNSKNNPDVSEKLAELQQRYFEQLPTKIKEIESLWQNYNVDSPDDSFINSLYQHAHTLTGSSGTFGAEQLSREAKELAIFLKKILEQHKLPTTEDSEVISRIIHQIKEQAQNSIYLIEQNSHWQE